ncbi:MAG: nicotinamide-nucleotide amidohydrolase family protein [Pseudomonadota bacterium]
MNRTAESVIAAFAAKGWRLATAESCTGGLVAGRLTDVAGSSAVVIGGVVAYANDVKERLLGVPRSVLATAGAVSEESAVAMAEGGRRLFDVDAVVSITGIAGPGGGTSAKPVGLVHFALATAKSTTHRRVVLPGDRRQVRDASVDVALNLLLSAARLG